MQERNKIKKGDIKMEKEKIVKAILKKYKGIFDIVEAEAIARSFEGCSLKFILSSIENDLYNLSK